MSGSPSPDGLFEALATFSSDPVLLTRTDGAVVRANEAACAQLGYSEAELQQLTRGELVVPAPEMETFLAERRQKRHARVRISLRRRDGTTFPTELTSTLLPGGEGPELSLVTFRDVSEQVRLERELKESEARFRTAFLTLPDAVTLADLTTQTIVAANEGAARVTGWATDELVGVAAASRAMVTEEDRAEFIRRMRADGSVHDLRTHLRKKDGSVIDVSVSGRPLTIEGRPMVLTVTRDVSAQVAAERARDELQAQLLQSQKLEAIGRLAGGMAHDFNNQLTVILSCCEELTERQPCAELDDIRAAVEHSTGLTRQLLSFARKHVIRRRPVNLDELVAQVQRLLTRTLGENVILVVERGAGLWPVSGDPVQLEQVVVNLALNARDAMPRGGNLTLSLTNVTLDEVGAATFFGARPGDYARLAVADTGVGMPPEVQAHVFEPFFTTKPQGKGTGLGLATVHGIVSQLGGFVRLESQVGKGTRFEVILPRAVSENAAPVEPEGAPVGGFETLVLIEDEPRVRQVIADWLRRAGYRVLVATDAASAHTLVQREAVALVVSDVMMPGQSGPELVAALRARHRELRALFVSGYAEDLDAGAAVLLKPFTRSALLARVRLALDTPAN